MAKTIEDYKKDYESARARGDSAGMQAANDGANAIRRAQGQAEEKATQDVAQTASRTAPAKATYDPSKPQGARLPDASYDDTPDRPLDDAYHEAEEKYKQQYEDAREKGDWEGMLSANQGMNQIRNDYGLAAQDASKDIDAIRQQSSGSGSSSGGGSRPSGAGLSDEMRELLEEWRDQAQEQQNAKIDYAVEQAVKELERAEADAQGDFKEQQEQIARDEMQGMDNSALYAELRGDKGGIGKEQYSSIQNTAAQNRLAVSQAQTKLSTDTARQIEDLRAQGEFQKADAALEVAQNYLSQLISLEQWATEYNLSTAQFQQAVKQWEAEFQASMDQFNANLELSKAELTGAFTDGTPTLTAKNQVNQQLASMGESLLSAGVMPTAEQLSAMGMTATQAREYLNILAMERAQAQAGSGGGGGGNDGKVTEQPGVNAYQQMYDAGIRTREEALLWLVDAGYGSYADDLASNFARWIPGYEEQQAKQRRMEEQEAYENAEIDQDSVNALGLGPISPEYLAKLESLGEIESYLENGKIKFRRTGYTGSAFPTFPVGGGIVNGK